MNPPLRSPRIRRAVALGFVVAAQVALAAGDYEGQWELKDTGGRTFEIWLHPDGKADGTHNEAMKHGTWAEEGGAAVIHWTTGWTTRIVKDGARYVKTAFRPGTAPGDKPTNHSEAKRIANGGTAATGR